MKFFLSLSVLAICLSSCGGTQTQNSESQNDTTDLAAGKIKVIIDSDANNELDDQHALAYTFFNGDVFDVKGVTVNNTRNGDGIEGQYEEAVRVAKLCDVYPEIPVIKGAAGNYDQIKGNIDQPDFDGQEAVDFIIETARANTGDPLILLPIGKLTNIALALLKAPDIIDKVEVVWLGSNYPNAGEYNLDNDTTSVNPVIESGVHFEMAVVRYAAPTGTGAVRVTRETIQEKMPDAGPEVSPPVEGRHGGEFTNFGDYSVNLFEKANMHGDPPSRALFDMAAVAVVKNPAWADKVEIPAPKLQGNDWVQKPENQNSIYIWENFAIDPILADFFETMHDFHLVE